MQVTPGQRAGAVFELNGSQVMLVKRDAARGGIVKSWQEIEQRALTGATGAGPCL